MNGAAAVQGQVVAPVQGRVRDARVKDDGAGGAPEAGEEFDDLLSQVDDASAADPTDTEPKTDETASGGRQAVALAALAGLGLAFAAPSETVADDAAPAVTDPMAALKAALAVPGDDEDSADVPEVALPGAAADTDPGSAAEALALLGSPSEARTTAKSVPVRQSDEVTVTLRATKRETHFAPVVGHHLAAPVQGPALEAAVAPENVADGAEPTLAALRGPAVPAGRADSGASDGKSDSSAARDSGSGDRRSSQVASVSGTEFAAVAMHVADAPETSTPAQQIAGRIASELGVGTGLANARVETSQASGPDGMTKVLHIQLEPANLGTVTVRVTLKDNVLSLHVEAARHETALALEKDREVLSGALKRSGYLVDGITAQSVDISRGSSQVQASSGTDAQSSSSTSTQSQSGQSQSGQQSEPRNMRTDGSGEERSSQRAAEPAIGVNDSRRGIGRGESGELYV